MPRRTRNAGFASAPRLAVAIAISLSLASTLTLVSACSGIAAPQPAALTTAPPPSATARGFVAGIRPSAEFQKLLDRSVEEIGRHDPSFLSATPRIAVIDLADPKSPRLAQLRGESSVYPASVVKFVYLMAAYAFQEQGRLTIDATMNTELTSMIFESSNQATRKVFARITGTEPGPELPPTEYATFRERRMAVKRWLESMGITDLHTVNPTYDGGGDLFGRDQQFLRDRTVTGGLPAAYAKYSNRQAMTASGTASLLALLAEDLALTPEDSTTVRERMRRSLRAQPHLVHRIAGGAVGFEGSEVYSKSGSWGPIYADAGIVQAASGARFVLVVFTEATPPYRGDAIADLTKLLAAGLFSTPPVAPATTQGGHP